MFVPRDIAKSPPLLLLHARIFTFSFVLSVSARERIMFKCAMCLCVFVQVSRSICLCLYALQSNIVAQVHTTILFGNPLFATVLCEYALYDDGVGTPLCTVISLYYIIIIVVDVVTNTKKCIVWFHPYLCMKAHTNYISISLWHHYGIRSQCLWMSYNVCNMYVHTQRTHYTRITWILR